MTGICIGLGKWSRGRCVCVWGVPFTAFVCLECVLYIVPLYIVRFCYTYKYKEKKRTLTVLPCRDK